MRQPLFQGACCIGKASSLRRAAYAGRVTFYPSQFLRRTPPTASNCFSTFSSFTRGFSFHSSSSSNANAPNIAAMADGVIPAVAELSVHDTTSEVSKYPNCYPTLNPVDKYRAHIAEVLAPIVGKEAEFVYGRLQWTNTLDKGDLLLPVSDSERGL